jgi:hypothetical protein
VIAELGQVQSVHEACTKIPVIGRSDFDRLVDQIHEHGLLHPVQVDSDGQLLDGRSRLMALHTLGIEIIDDMIAETNAAPIAIAQANLARRHMNEKTIEQTRDQLAMLAAELLEKERAAAAKRKKEGQRKGGQAKARQAKFGGAAPPKQKRASRPEEKVAKETGVSQRVLRDAKELKEKYPEIAEQVKAGEVSLNDARKKAGLASKKTTSRASKKNRESRSFIRPSVVFEDGPIVVAYLDVRVVASIFQGKWKVSAHDDQSSASQPANNAVDAKAIAIKMAEEIVARRKGSTDDD